MAESGLEAVEDPSAVRSQIICSVGAIDKQIEAMGLEIVELFMAFEISIPDDVAPELDTPRKVTDYITSKVAGRGMTRAEVAARVRQVIEAETASFDFSEDDHFVRDMNLD